MKRFGETTKTTRRKKIKKLLLRFLNFFIARNQYQKIFEWFHLFTLIGMNFIAPSDSENSGEKAAFQHLLKKLSQKEPLIIFDVGANIGSYTQMLINLLKARNATIHAFEPAKKTFEKLSSNIQNANVFPHNFGFGKENRKMTLFSDSEESGLASLYPRQLDYLDIHMNLSEEVEIKTIDLFCLEEKINHIHFLKIDAEGNEFDIIKGAKEMLEQNAIDFIQFEFGGCNIDSRIFFKDFFILLSGNYNICRILRNGRYPIKCYKEELEIFMLANYLAERKNI